MLLLHVNVEENSYFITLAKAPADFFLSHYQAGP